MPEMYRYTHTDLPEYFAHQIRDFVRIHWYDVFQFNIHAPCLPKEWQPHHFILGDAPALYSHSAVVSRPVRVNGVALLCGGLSSVLTYPAFRGKGYGNQLVQLSTQFIQSQPFDMALLWTDPKNDRFYAKYGWQHHENVTCTHGKKEHPSKYELYSMLMIFSEKAEKALHQAQNPSIFIGVSGW